MKQFLRKGSVIKVRKVAPEEVRVWVEGVAQPLPLDALVQHIEPQPKGRVSIARWNLKEAGGKIPV